MGNSYRAIFRSLILILLVVSCKKTWFSSSNDQGASHSSGVVSVALMESLPECSASAQGHLVFVEAEKTFFVCSRNTWIKTNSSGSTGPQGPRGINGLVESELSEQWRSIFADSVKSVAYIEVKHTGHLVQNGQVCAVYYSGTGFLVDRDLVMTAAHVLQDREDSVCLGLSIDSVYLWFASSSEGESSHSSRGADARGSKVDLSDQGIHDLALLLITPQNRQALPVSTIDFGVVQGDLKGGRVADPILALGYTGGSTFVHLTPGNISGFGFASTSYLGNLISKHFIREGTSVIEITAMFGGGASGGPLLRTNGEVLGVISAGDAASVDSEFGYCIDSRHMRDFLKKERTWRNL